MTIHVPKDLARLIKDAVRSGRYAYKNDVIRDALIRLQQPMEVTAATADQSGEMIPQKPLTELSLQRHLAKVGLIAQAPRTSAAPDVTDAPLLVDEEAIIAEEAVRERLIEWLVRFL